MTIHNSLSINELNNVAFRHFNIDNKQSGNDHKDNQQYHQNQNVMFKPKTIFSNQRDSTTSSDTLIDADSSFADSIAKIDYLAKTQTVTNSELNCIKPIPVYIQSQQNTGQHFNYSSVIANQNKVNLTQQQILEPSKISQKMTFLGKNRLERQYDQEEDEDEDKIVINIDELSLTNLVSLEHETTEESIQVPFKPDQNIGVDQLNQHLQYQQQFNNQIIDNEFEHDLKTLDEKIFKVKQMLESMKRT